MKLFLECFNGIVLLVVMVLLFTIENYAVLLIPIVFLLLSFMFIEKILLLFNYKIFYLLYLLLFLKYCVTPILFSIENNEHDFNLEVLLNIYELISLFVLIFFITKSNFFIRGLFIKFGIKYFDVRFRSVFILVFFIILVFNFEYKNINFITNFLDYSVQLKEDSGAVENNSLGLLLFQIVRLLFLFYLISFFNRKISDLRISESLSYFFVFVFSLFIIGSSRNSILYSFLPFVLLLSSIYKINYRKVSLIITMLFFVILYTTYAKFNSKNIYSSDSYRIVSAETFNSYFSGLQNIKIGLDENEYYSFNFKLLKNDIFKNIPIVSKYINHDETTSSKFNRQKYNDIWGAKDQIPPLSIFAINHFMIFFSPVYLLIFFYLSIFCEYKSINNSSIDKKVFYYYLAVLFSFALIGNYSAIIGRLFLSIIIFVPIFFLKKLI